MLILVSSPVNSREFTTAIDTALVSAALEKFTSICFAKVQKHDDLNEHVSSSLQQLEALSVNVLYKEHLCSELLSAHTTCLSF